MCVCILYSLESNDMSIVGMQMDHILTDRIGIRIKKIDMDFRYLNILADMDTDMFLNFNYPYPYSRL